MINQIKILHGASKWGSSIFWESIIKYRVMLYVKSVRIGSYSGPYFPAFGLNIRIQSECGKIWTKITLNMDTFQAVMAPNVVIILFTNLVRSYYLFIYLFIYFILFIYFYFIYFILRWLSITFTKCKANQLSLTKTYQKLRSKYKSGHKQDLKQRLKIEK